MERRPSDFNVCGGGVWDVGPGREGMGAGVVALLGAKLAPWLQLFSLSSPGLPPLILSLWMFLAPDTAPVWGACSPSFAVQGCKLMGLFMVNWTLLLIHRDAGKGEGPRF